MENVSRAEANEQINTSNEEIKTIPHKAVRNQYGNTRQDRFIGRMIFLPSL